MGFNSPFQLVPYGADGKRPLQILKCLLNPRQQQIIFPDGFWRSGLHVGTKQITPLAPIRLPQAFPIHTEHANIFARHREDVNSVGRHYKPFLHTYPFKIKGFTGIYAQK